MEASVWTEIRIYFNARGNPEEAWSYDAGVGTPEFHCAVLVVLDVMMLSQYDPASTPCAWFVAYNVRVHAGTGSVLISR